MSVKVKQAIEKSLVSITKQTFDEDTIRTLLISSREYLKRDSLIKELAHFIAHPERNMGLFHRKLNSRYTKFKLVQNHVLKFDLSFLKENIQNEDQLSDFMLSAISVEKIESKLFKILYEDGLEDLPEEHLKKYTGLNKSQVAKILKENYTISEGYHCLITHTTEQGIAILKMMPEDEETRKTINDATKLVSNIKTSVDNLQKVIRGAIYFKSVFDDSWLFNDFQQSFELIVKTFGIDTKYLKAITNNADGILLCLMTLLHDSKFIFYDKNEGKVSLRTYFEDRDFMINNPEYNNKEILYENATLALYVDCNTDEEKSLAFPLFVSDLKINQYVSKEYFMLNSVGDSLQQIPWINAIRVNTKLMLTDN